MASHERFAPSELFDARLLAYSQAMKSRGDSYVHVAGQAALDRDLQLVGAGDFAKQARTCFENVGHALRSAGACPADVVWVRLYVVGLEAAHIPILKEALLEFFGPDSLPPGTLLGVSALAMPGLMLEVEAAAIV